MVAVLLLASIIAVTWHAEDLEERIAELEQSIERIEQGTERTVQAIEEWQNSR